MGPVGSGNWSLNQPAWDFFEDTVRELNRRNIGVLCVLATWKIYVQGTKLDPGTPYDALPVYQDRMRNMEKRYPYFIYVCNDIILAQGEYMKDHATRAIAPWLAGPTWAGFLDLRENKPRTSQIWWPCRPGMQLAADPAKGRFEKIPAAWRDLPAMRMPVAGRTRVDVTVDRDVNVYVVGAAPADFARGSLSVNGHPAGSKRFPAGPVSVDLPEGALTVVIEPLDRTRPGPGQAPLPTH